MRDSTDLDKKILRKPSTKLFLQLHEGSGWSFKP